MSWEIRQGDCLSLLRAMPDESVQTCVTSPPYWGLRDYGTAEWEGPSEQQIAAAAKCIAELPQKATLRQIDHADLADAMLRAALASPPEAGERCPVCGQSEGRHDHFCTPGERDAARGLPSADDVRGILAEPEEPRAEGRVE